MHSLAIVIPINSVDWNQVGVISVKQILSLLNKYDIFFIKPESFEFPLNLGSISNIKIVNFSEEYFGSQEAHNKLLMAKELYEYFADYEYMLIHHMDAFMFEDRLEYFMDLNYDYIGAPWNSNRFFYDRILNVGNGGFSLRKIKSFIDNNQYLHMVHEGAGINEDVGIAVLGMNGILNVAPYEVAREFAVEDAIFMTYVKNGNRLPMACHAWHKFDTIFLKPFIEKYGCVIPNEYLNSGIIDYTYLMCVNKEAMLNHIKNIKPLVQNIVFIGMPSMREVYVLHALYKESINLINIVYNTYINEYYCGAKIVSSGQFDYSLLQSGDVLTVVGEDADQELIDRLEQSVGADYIMLKDIDDIYIQ